MARPYWRGNVRVSLVSFGVEIYSAVSGTARVQLNQLHKDCGQRIKMPTTCPVHGQVERTEIIKGYEFEKGRYVPVEAEEIAAIKLKSEKTVEITSFVPDNAVDDLYLESTYYVGPDNVMSQEPFRVFRQALAKGKMAGIGAWAHGG